MKALAKSIRTSYTESGDQELTLTLTTKQPIDAEKAIITNGKLLSIEIGQQKKKRSLDSNSYLWILCQKIAEAVQSTKELVYQQFVRDVGQFQIVPLQNEQVEFWINTWNDRGLGWYAEVLHESKIPGYTNIINYFGSSVYDQREMSVLLDEVVREAKELNIEVLPPAEIEALKKSWKG